MQHVFTSWSSLSEIKVGKQGIVLCHYAMKVWPHHSRGTWQLYGHSHGNLPDDPLSFSMDVGVDSHDFKPWHFDDIQVIMKVKAEAKAKRLQQGNREASDNVEDLKEAEQITCEEPTSSRPRTDQDVPGENSLRPPGESKT